MVTLLIVIGLIGGTCAIIYGMVFIAMMLGKKSKKAAAAKAAMQPANKMSTNSPTQPSPAIKRVHTT
jgi:predicted membrane protein